MDFEAFKRELLRHCLWMAGRDPTYAQWAAEQYEKTSGGLLKGLADKVRGAIKKHVARTSDSP